MKNIIKLIALAFFCTSLSAQSPELFNYQGLAVDAGGRPYKNQKVTLQLSLLENGVNGSAIFVEQHDVTTSDQGVFSLHIGDGFVQSGTFASATWATKEYWLMVEADFQGGSNFSPLSTSKMVSVPYALHAETVTNKDDADANPSNELQTLSISGDQLTISNGNTVNLPTGGGGGNDNDEDPNNEIQDLTSSNLGTEVMIDISHGGLSTTFSIEDADADPGNEIQNLSISNNELSISSGNKVSLNGISTPWENDVDGIKYTQGNAKVQNQDGYMIVGPTFIEGEGFGAQVHVEPGNISVSDTSQSSTYSQMSFDRMFVYNWDDDQGSQMDDQSVIIYDAECSSELKKNSLAFRDSTNFELSRHNKDSIYFYNAVGLGFPDASFMKATHLGFETFGLSQKSVMGPGASSFITDVYTSEHSASAFRIFQNGNGNPDRFIATGDSLTMWNSAKWRNVDIRTSNAYGGSIDLFGQSGVPTISINSTWDAGNICTIGPNGFTNTCIGTSSTFNRGSITVSDEIGAPVVELVADTLNRGSIHATNNIYIDEFLGSVNPIVSIERQGIHSAILKIDGENDELNVYAGYRTGHRWDGTPPPNDTRGEVSVVDSNGDFKAGMYVNEFDEGNLYVKNGLMRVINENNGIDGAWNNYNLNQYGPDAIASSIGRDYFYENTGLMTLWGENGSLNVEAGFDLEAGDLPSANYGLLAVSDDESVIRASMNGEGYIRGEVLDLKEKNGDLKFHAGENDGFGSGWVSTYGPNGTPNITGASSNNGNNGWFAVSDEDGNPRAGFIVDENDNNNGLVFADIKHFRMDHPEDANKEIWYASLEGPEAGAYVRGTAELINGEAFVPFPHHFALVANSESITVQLTPRFWDTYGLAVVEIKSDGILVKELKGGQGNFKFDWEAKGVRKGFEDYKAVLSKDEVNEVLMPKKSKQ